MTLFLLLAACTGGFSPFNQGGDYNVPPDSLAIGDSGGDTAITEVPRISAIRADFADYPNIGDVIEVGLVILDADEDIEGGVIELTVENTTWGTVNTELEVDGSNAYLDDGEVIFAIANVSTDESYALKVVFNDVAGNRSNMQEVSVE